MSNSLYKFNNFFEKVIHNTPWAPILSTLVGVTASIAGYLLSEGLISTLTLTETEKALASFSITLLPFFATQLLGFWFMMQQAQNTFMKTASNVKDAVKRNHSAFFYGASKEVNPYIAERIRSCSDIKNTLVGLNSNWNDRIITQAISDWASNANSRKWQDICGIEDYFSDRYKSVRKIKKQHGDFECFILKHSTPIVNFIILKGCPHHEDEVFWGWRSGDTQGNSQVFGSRNPEIINFFTENFSELIDKSWNTNFAKQEGMGLKIDFERARNDREFGREFDIVNKVGRWITFSYVFDAKQKDKFFQNRTGIVDIIADTGQLCVSSVIFDSDGKNEEKYTRHNLISHYKNNVFIEYTLEASNIPGICHYKFIHRNAKDLIVGVYTDRRNEKRNTIIGIRIDPGHEIDLDHICSHGNDAINELSRYKTALESRMDFSQLVRGNY